MLTSVSDGLPYINFCNEVMNDKSGKLLESFRRNPDYDLVVPGNRPGSQMEEHVELLKKKYPWILKHMKAFQIKQGVFGNPTIHKFDIADVPLDVSLPLHIYYLALTIQAFGELHGMRICEIGAGAGLFYKLVTDIFPDVQYTFVDLLAPLYIQRKHVEWLGRQRTVAEYLDCDTVMSGVSRAYDLVISDCAFNELHKDVQDKYINFILNSSECGRIAFYEADMPIPTLGIEDVYDRIESDHKRMQRDLRVPTLYWGLEA